MRKYLFLFPIFLFVIALAACSQFTLPQTTVTTFLPTSQTTTTETVFSQTGESTTIDSTVGTTTLSTVPSSEISTTAMTTTSSTSQLTTSAPTTISTTEALTTTTLVSTTTPFTTTISESTTFTTSTVVTKQYETIELFSINDFHGGAYTDITMISKIGEYLQYKNSQSDYVAMIASGDILQGSALSNYYYGLPLIEALNVIGFDAFTIGNHEFDWGIDKIANYADLNPVNGEASYPFLAANIVDEITGERLPWTEPYTIIDMNGIRVGIIGVIGDVINSISASRVEGIQFLDAADTVYEYAAILRTEEACDIVVVSLHEYEYGVNEEIANFAGENRVDAIFNGHTHSSLSSAIERPGMDLPYVQASNYSSSLFGKITFVYDRDSQSIINFQTEIISESQLFLVSNDVNTILDVFSTDPDYQAFVTQELATVQSAYAKSSLAPWGASVIRDYAGVDFGMLNSGGFRTGMDSGVLTMGELVVIYPFDNYIKTSWLSGAEITALYEKVQLYEYDLVFDDQVTYVGGVLYQDGIAVSDDVLYQVGAVDYVFDKSYYPFAGGVDVQLTDLLIRNLLAQDLLSLEEGTLFNPANGTNFESLVPVGYVFDPQEFRKQRIFL